MAKRFISTNLFNDSWFMELDMKGKLFYIYLITNCDHAGIIDFNPKLAEVQIGIPNFSKTYRTVVEQLGNRLISLKNQYYFLPRFINFQYPKGLNYNVIAQASVIKRLKEFDLLDEENLTLKQDLVNSCLTVQDKDIDKEKDIDKVKDKDKYADFVLMTKIVYEKLIEEYGEEATKWMIWKLDNFKGSKGKQYKSDYKAILSWVVEAYQKNSGLNKW